MVNWDVRRDILIEEYTIRVKERTYVKVYPTMIIVY
jgi:hypothetical protein